MQQSIDISRTPGPTAANPQQWHMERERIKPAV